MVSFSTMSVREWFLVNADADGVQNYIFATPDLKLVRGASAVQTKLNRECLRDEVSSHGGHVISANGGTVIARFPEEEQAERFREAADRLFREHTHSATVTTVIVPYPEGDF